MHGTSTSRQALRRWMLGAAAIALLPLALAACGSDESGSSMSDAAARTRPDDAVDIELVAYKPGKLTVDAGTTVTWRQRDPGSHTVTSGTVEQGTGDVTTAPDGGFASGELTTDERFEFAFTEPGTYPYFCEIHPATMRGEITVR